MSGLGKFPGCVFGDSRRGNVDPHVQALGEKGEQRRLYFDVKEIRASFHFIRMENGGEIRGEKEGHGVSETNCRKYITKTAYQYLHTHACMKTHTLSHTHTPKRITPI